MKAMDRARSWATLIFLRELATKQDELLRAMMNLIGAIEVEQPLGKGFPAWTTVQENVARDYEKILQFCQAGLDLIIETYPMEETKDDNTGTDGRGGSILQTEPVGNDGETE